jgi:transposase
MIKAAIERCAGIDVGKKWLAVCIMVGPLDAEPRTETRKFGTNVADLEQLRDWLKENGITHAVMESTGSYWKPVFNILEEALTVYLANPHQVKPRKGHKTDNKDGHWLAHLLRHAMIQPSFIPKRDIRELRDLTRRRKKLIGAGTSEKNRIQKVLEDGNVKLGNVLSDVFGVSGQLMLNALLEGKAGPREIAQMAQRRARKKIPELVAALDKHRMSDHHRHMIRFSVEHMELLEKQIAQLDEAIVAKIREIGLVRQWELLQTIPGMQAISAATILAETGPDMEQFGDERNISSWAGVCPGNNRSAGKSKSSHTNKGNPWLRSALTECAQGASKKKDCFLKDKFWRITTKHGGKRAPAVMAVAHNLLRFVFQVLSTGKPYQARSATPLEPQQRERMIRHHIRRLGKLGIAVGQRGPAPLRPRRRTTAAKDATLLTAST